MKAVPCDDKFCAQILQGFMILGIKTGQIIISLPSMTQVDDEPDCILMKYSCFLFLRFSLAEITTSMWVEYESK